MIGEYHSKLDTITQLIAARDAWQKNMRALEGQLKTWPYRNESDAKISGDLFPSFPPKDVIDKLLIKKTDRLDRVLFSFGNGVSKYDLQQEAERLRAKPKRSFLERKKLRKIEKYIWNGKWDDKTGAEALLARREALFEPHLRYLHTNKKFGEIVDHMVVQLRTYPETTVKLGYQSATDFFDTVRKHQIQPIDLKLFDHRKQDEMRRDDAQWAAFEAGSRARRDWENEMRQTGAYQANVRLIEMLPEVVFEMIKAKLEAGGRAGSPRENAARQRLTAAYMQRQEAVWREAPRV